MKRLLLIPVAFVLILFIYFISQKSQSKNLQINDIYLNNISIENQVYIFNHGKVLKQNREEESGSKAERIRQLVAFYTIVREDPIFSLSRNEDLNSFGQAITGLEILKKKMEGVYKKPLPLYPVSFLKTLVQTSTAEKKFLKDVSLENAKLLLAAYKKSVDSYSSTSLGLINFARKTKISTNIILLGVSVSTDNVLSDIFLLENNSNALKKEIAKREECLNLGRNCYRPQEAFKKPKENITFDPPSGELLPLDVLFPDKSADERKNVEGPFFVRSACWGWGEDYGIPKQQTYVLTTKIQESASGTVDLYKLGTESFYRRYNVAPAGKPEKMIWISRGDSQPYICTTSEYQFQIETMRKFVKDYENKPLLKDNMLEREIISGKNRDWDAYLVLANIYAYEYSKTENESLRSSLINRYLAISRKTNSMDLAYDSLAVALRRNIIIAEENMKKNPDNIINFFVFFRTYWDIFYMPYSDSFWRISQDPKYLDMAKIEEKRKNFYTYHELLKTMTPEEIKNITLETRKLQIEGKKQVF